MMHCHLCCAQRAVMQYKPLNSLPAASYLKCFASVSPHSLHGERSNCEDVFPMSGQAAVEETPWHDQNSPVTFRITHCSTLRPSVTSTRLRRDAVSMRSGMDTESKGCMRPGKLIAGTARCLLITITKECRMSDADKIHHCCAGCLRKQS